MSERRLTDKQAKRLLDRAAELDAEQAHSVDVPTLREIAAEAGISPAAVDAALRESEARKDVPAVPRRPPLRGRVLARVALALALGYLMAAFLVRLFP